MTYGVAFYRASHGRWWDKLIAARTGSRYSHCELVLGDTIRRDASGNCIEAVCISASPRAGCVRSKRIVFDEGKWDLVMMPFPAGKSIESCDAYKALGEKYDWPGVISAGLFPVPGFQVPKWWFCSEWVYKTLLDLGYFGHIPWNVPPYEVKPSNLYDYLYGFCNAWAHAGRLPGDSAK